MQALRQGRLQQLYREAQRGNTRFDARHEQGGQKSFHAIDPTCKHWTSTPSSTKHDLMDNQYFQLDRPVDWYLHIPPETSYEELDTLLEVLRSAQKALMLIHSLTVSGVMPEQLLLFCLQHLCLKRLDLSHCFPNTAPVLQKIGRAHV